MAGSSGGSPGFSPVCPPFKLSGHALVDLPPDPVLPDRHLSTPSFRFGADGGVSLHAYLLGVCLAGREASRRLPGALVWGQAHPPLQSLGRQRA